MGNCDSEDVIAGTPVETGHNYFVDETEKLSAGVWECTAYTAVFDAYPVDEFCHILSGRVIITDGEGKAETFLPGDCFVIPRGLKCTWHMPETTRKYYVILDMARDNVAGHHD
jgi:uncharacterized cupin superfamily protein